MQEKVEKYALSIVQICGDHRLMITKLISMRLPDLDSRKGRVRNQKVPQNLPEDFDLFGTGPSIALPYSNH